MKIALDNIAAKVSEATEEERLWLSKFLSFTDDSTRHKTGNEGKPTKFKLFNRYQSTFPAGLYGIVRRGALRKKFTVEVTDLRKATCSRDLSADIAWLRWYQTEAIDAIVQEKRGIIQAPTGSGKGEIVVALTKALPCTWLFVVHRQNLVNDIAERYRKNTGLEPIFYEDGMKMPTSGLVLVTFQALVAALKQCSETAEKLLALVGGLIVDECHIQAADSFFLISQRTTNAYWRVGLSGTPLARGDRRGVKAVGALGDIIYRIKIKTLIDEGVLAAPIIRMVRVEQYSARATYQGVYGALVAKSTIRNQAIIDCTVDSKKPCLVFVKQDNQGNEIKKRLMKLGFNVDFVNGKVKSTKKREALATSLVRGDLDVLVASVVFQEGIDIPSLESVVLAHGGRSIISTMQRIGRGMRTDNGKKMTFEVWDIFDEGCSALEKHSKVRRAMYKREQFEHSVLPFVYRKDPKQR